MTENITRAASKVMHAGSCSSLAKVHSHWWWLRWKIVFCSWEFALSNSVIVLFVSIVVSMEINRRHYFRSGPRSCVRLELCCYFQVCSRSAPKWYNWRVFFKQLVTHNSSIYTVQHTVEFMKSNLTKPQSKFTWHISKLRKTIRPLLGFCRILSYWICV